MPARKGSRKGPDGKFYHPDDIPSGVEHTSNNHGDGSEPVVTVSASCETIIDPGAIARAASGTGGDSGTGAGTASGRTTGAKKKKNSKAVNVSAIETLLFSVHTMGASILSVPEMVLDEGEAKNLAVAMGKVADQYDSLPGMSEMQAAWINLFMVTGVIYGSRVGAYRLRMMNEKAEKES